MKCIKTGIKFQIDEMKATWHGDLYYNASAKIYLMMGIAKKSSNFPPDIILASSDDLYQVIYQASSFWQFMAEWNPAYPIVKAIIIADTRFI